MLTNYLIAAFRSFRKQKVYSFINLTGLTLGLAGSLLIVLWVQDELRVDQFHARGDRLFLVMKNDFYSDGQIETNPATPGPLAEALAAEVPEVDQVVRTTGNWEQLLSVGDDHFKERGYFADSTFFELFSFPLLAGDPSTVFRDVSSIVISEPLALKYFGSAGQAVGKTIRLNHEADYRISGVFQEVPTHSSLQFDFVLPFSVVWNTNEHIQSWGNNFISTYVLLHPQASPATVGAKIKDMVKKRYAEANTELFLFPFAQQYLTEFAGGKPSGGRIVLVRLFALIAAFILLIACINFMNLATARSAQRAKEVGVRKAIGARRSSLVVQFMLESVVTTTVALVGALLLTELLLPTFNQLTEKSMAVPYQDPYFLLLLGGLTLFTGLLAGSYPAFFLSSFDPVRVLKGTIRTGVGARSLRQGLVVFQFVLSMVLITGTLVVYQQIHYIQDKDLGVNRENLIYFEGTPDQLARFATYKNALQQQPGIRQVTTASAPPISLYNNTTWFSWDGKNPNDQLAFNVAQVNYDFLETAGITLKEGRTFSTDTANVLINEEAARRMGMTEPVGQRMMVWGREGRIIGVVRDFHNQDLHTAIPPLILSLRPEDASQVLVRTEAGATAAALASLEALHDRYGQGYPFEYHFVDEDFERMYRTDTLVGQLSGYFGFLAIFISCLGLFGLAAYTVEWRTKEIGIRKVLGASVRSLVVLFSASFTKLVLLALVGAVPISWWLARQFLEGYAYRIDLSVGVFLLAGGLALLIAVLTVGYQSVKAARANPVDSLRSE